MKKLHLTIWSVCLLRLIIGLTAYAQIRIGPGSLDPIQNSASLEVKSGPYSTGSQFKGFLLPTVTTTQRNQIQSPAKGLCIFNSITNQLEVNTGSSVSPIWTPGGAVSVGGNNSWLLSGNSGTTSANFLGTTDFTPLNFKVNNLRAGLIEPTLYSVAFGYPTLNVNATGEANTAYGAFTLPNQNTNASFNVAIGYRAMFTNTSGGVNVALGSFALEGNTVGTNNTGLGHSALRLNTSGQFNTGVGTGALAVNSSGYENTAMGANSAGKNTTGYSNLALGTDALSNNIEGYDNVAVGASSLLNGTGFANTSVGTLSLLNTTSGFYNTAVGDLAGQHNTSGYFNTFVGVNAGPVSGNGALINAIAIGAESVVGSNHTIVLGNNQITALRCNVQSISTLSDRRVKENITTNVPGLNFINRLMPVTYNINKQKEAALLGYSSGEVKDDFTLHSGFIAQDVEAAAKAVGYNFEGVRQEENGKYYTVGYTLFVMPLVQAVKELSADVEQLKLELTKRDKYLNELKDQVQHIQDSLKRSFEIEVVKTR